VIKHHTEEAIDLSTCLADVWRILSDDEREALRTNARVERFARNKRIYSEGDVPKDMMCLLSGKVKISKEGIGRNQIVRMIRPIQYFGYRAYFAREDYLTNASACEDSTICLVPMTLVVDMLESNIKMAMFFIRQLSIDLGISDSRTVTLTQKHIRGRLAEALLLLKDKYGIENDGSTLSIYLSRKELADLSNMTTGNAISTLSAFVSEKLVAVDGRKIKLMDQQRLMKISEMG